MQLACYPYEFDYNIRNGKVYVYLYSKTLAGQQVCLLHEYEAFFYVRVPAKNKETKENQESALSKISSLEISDGSQQAKVTEVKEVVKEYLGKKQSFWQVFVSYPKAVPLLAKELQSLGLECFEKDILFIHRFLRDKKIIPMQEILVEGDYLDATFIDEPALRVPFFMAKSLEPSIKGEKVPRWKILGVDIETYATKKEIDPEQNPILMIALSGIDEEGAEFQKVITWKQFPHAYDYIEHVSDEKEMLARFRSLVLEYGPEIITGYFSDGFDLPYIQTRALKHKTTLDLGLDGSEMQVFSKTGFRSSEVKIKGILHLDMLKFIKQIFGLNLKTDSYTLDAVAQELLGHSKHKVNLDDFPRIWDSQPEKLAQYCAYNLHDALLARKLCEKLLSDMMEFTYIMGLPPFDVTRMHFSKLVENYILKRAIEFNVVAPNKAEGAEIEGRREESIQGAFVYQPTPGVYQNIAVFDFRSLYPTIITAHNLGPEAFRCSCCKDKEHVPEKEEYWFCQREKKFIPRVLDDLITKRTAVKKQLKEEKKKGGDVSVLEARTYALKILANAFYGYLGFFGARWYCLECAASTTAYARNYIKKTMETARENGLEVLYGDTDSLFLLLGQKNIDEAKMFMDGVNAGLPGQMELEFEGYFPRGIFVATKGTNIGAKKKYALLREDKSLKIVGFETVRRNWSPLAKEVQEKVLYFVLDHQVDAALKFVKEIVASLKEGKIGIEKLIIKTQITRDLHQYASIGPHVLVARKMEERGERVVPGMVVEYVVAAGSGLVRERAALPEDIKEGNYDVEYYLRNQVLPAVVGIFNVFGHTEEDILGKGKQTGLGKWF